MMWPKDKDDVYAVYLSARQVDILVDGLLAAWGDGAMSEAEAKCLAFDLTNGLSESYTREVYQQKYLAEKATRDGTDS